MPEFHAEILEQHIASCQAQKNVAIRGIVAVDAKDAELFGTRVQCRLSAVQIPLEIAAVRFTERRADGSVRGRRPLGEALFEVIRSQVEQDYVCVVGPHERLLSNHLCSLLRTLQDLPEAGCAWSDMLQGRHGKDKEQADLCDDPDVSQAADGQPIGFGRFLFRMSAIEDRIQTALPYLDALSMQLLLGSSKNVPTRRCTLVTADGAGRGQAEQVVPLELEREILIDLSPELFETKKPKASQEQPPPAAFSLSGMTPQERTQLAVELAHSIPIPGVLKKLAFGVYRLWFRVAGSRPGTQT
jgi:hypothetical protein